MKKSGLGIFIIFLIIPLLVGGISAAISAEGMATYSSMLKPPLSPPGWVFSVAWTLLYIMMGAASYLVFSTDVEVRDKTVAFVLYGVQLALNFMWSIIFFNMGQYLIALIWLLILWVVVIICTYKFRLISKRAAYLMIPYILWLTFAAYLNAGAYVLNNFKI